MKYMIETPNKKNNGIDYSGLFITFEGPEGSGKSTQSKRIYDILNKEFETLAPLTKEPGGPESDLQSKIRQLYFFNEEERSPEADLFLMLTDRALHQRFLLKNLVNGNIVICDRYADSTRAYQGGGGGLDLNMIDAFNAIATKGLEPDITFLVDASYETAMKRKKGDNLDYFEKKERDFHIRVRDMYHKIAIENPNRFIVVNGEPSIEVVSQEILKNVINHSAYQAYLKRKI